MKASPIFEHKPLLFLVAQAPLEAGAGKVLINDFRGSHIPPCLGWDFSFAALPCAVIVHGEDLEKDFAVLFGIRRGRHEHAQNGRPHQDEWLAAPPLAQTGECLPVVCLTLFIGFGGEPGDRELGFDESGHEAEFTFF